MALTYDQITAVTQRRYIPKMVDNIFDSDPLLQRAKAKGWYTPIDGGTSIFQPLMYASLTSAGSYAAGATLDTDDNDTFTSAEYAWKFYYANLTVSGPDEMKNTGAARVLDFVKQKVMAAELTLKDKIGDGIHGTGTPSTDIGGLRLIVDAGNTVGAIAQADYSWWQSQEDSTTTVLSIGDLQTQFNAISIGGKTPTVGVATRANYNRIYNLLQPQQRFVDSQTAKAGFQSIMLNGVPIVVSSKAAANHFFWLNEEFLHLYYHPQRNFVFDPFIKSSNQDAKSGKIFWMGNLGTSNARMFGKFSGLTA